MGCWFVGFAVDYYFCEDPDRIGGLWMRREYPHQPVVGVGAVIVDCGKLVLVKRAAEP